jgi:uncharacterized coiled-coil protein SlyX
MIEIEKKLVEHGEQLKTLFSNLKTIEKLTNSVQELAQSISTQTEQIKNMDKRLSSIEETSKYKNNTVWACIVTGVIGAVISYIISNALR